MNNTEERYALNGKQDGRAVIDEALANLIGETVCVSYTTSRNEKVGHRSNFEPQISVQSKLEGSKETGKYRVLIDQDNYSYFYADSVWSMAKDNDKRAVVFIS
jgi:hypothetical protein|tara:strand:- start:496 stop:804 length:309 start_codon:yes stop_codon:yes gene_type:complete